MSALRSMPSVLRNATIAFVFAASNLNSETTRTSPAAIFSETARANASFITFLLIFWE